MKGTPGAYILLFRIGEDKAIKVGRLGQLLFSPGHYAYVGSALGGLQARVDRHLHGGKNKHWHIDYLICHADQREALLFPSDKDIECDLTRLVSRLPGVTPGPAGFGSSDCQCPTHLFFLEDEAVAVLRRIVTELNDRGR